MDGNAIVLTSGLLDTKNAKTAHGLIRGTERYNIVGIIDEKFEGQDAGEVLDGKKRNIPIYKSVEAFQCDSSEKADYLIIGIATKGGYLPAEMVDYIKSAIKIGCSIVSGLHEFLEDKPEIVELAKVNKVNLIDVRKPKPSKELHFWNGSISKVTTPIVAVIGTDCNMGKRTTSRFLMEAMREKGYNAHMIYTGQTGWMQGGKYGFIFDSTLNDFIAGEVEHAIVSCFENENPDIIFLEGQSALRNPNGPCGTEFLISGNAEYTILQHDPVRKYFQGCEGYKVTIPTLKEEIDLIKIYRSETIGVTINTKEVNEEQAKSFQEENEKALNIPVVAPLFDGVDRIVEAIEKKVLKK
ncbi:MAG: DUF1611 domain-containing protein [Flammeovirgaceae bacterium]|nr:DUF1611 domain-containing protein [Flammeovirgaceae bacterium]